MVLVYPTVSTFRSVRSYMSHLLLATLIFQMVDSFSPVSKPLMSNKALCRDLRLTTLLKNHNDYYNKLNQVPVAGDKYQLSLPMSLLDVDSTKKSDGVIPRKRKTFTLDPYYTGRNKYLLQWEYEEPSFNRPFKGTLDDFVQYERYKAGHEWWLVPGTVADITAGNSRSPLRMLYGPDAYREIYWPNDGHGEPDLSNFRIALNCIGTPKDSKQKSLEMFFRNPETGEHEPFMYLYEGERYTGTWTPVTEVNEVPLKKFCYQCHRNADGTLSGFPRAIFGSNKTIQKSGYYPEFWDLLLEGD